MLGDESVLLTFVVALLLTEVSMCTLRHLPRTSGGDDHRHHPRSDSRVFRLQDPGDGIHRDGAHAEERAAGGAKDLEKRERPEDLAANQGVEGSIWH